MPDVSLPSSAEQLRELLDQASALATESRSIVEALRQIEERPGSVMPTRLHCLPTGGLAVVRVLSLPTMLNEALQDLAARADPVLDYLGLRRAEVTQIRRLIPLDPAEHGTAGSSADTQSSDLILAGLLEVVEVDGSITRPSSAEVQKDRLRVDVLVRLVESLAEKAEACCTRVRRKLNPPTVRDRVRVDRARGLVTVDGAQFNVLDTHATVLHYLVEGNGAAVSSSVMRAGEDVSEFKLSKFVGQIRKKFPDLGRIIKKQPGSNGLYYIDLPPLE